MALLEGAIAGCSAVSFGRSRLWADAELGSRSIPVAGGSDRMIALRSAQSPLKPSEDEWFKSINATLDELPTYYHPRLNAGL
jgi:hypothetical protein